MDDGEEAGLPWWTALEGSLSRLEFRPRIVVPMETAHLTDRRGKPYVVVRNIASSRYLRLEERENGLLPLMDGTRSVMDLVVTDYGREGELATGRVLTLVRTLRTNHFLDTPHVDAYEGLNKVLHRRGADDLVAKFARGFRESQVATRRLDPLFGWLYGKVGHWFFARPAVAVGWLLALAGPALFLGELARGRYAIGRAGESYVAGFVLLFVIEVFILSVHELGHALAVKHAGRSVRETGVMIYYGYPAAFVDTTDIWMAPRRARIAASLAGPWTGLVVGGAAAALALILPEGPAGTVLFSIAFICIVNDLMNFNPLLELDGYFILVDLVERPMLRARSLAFVRNELWRRLWRRSPFPPEERWLAVFGLASAAFSVIILGLAVWYWQVRGLPAIREAWGTGNAFAQGAVVLVAGLVAMIILLAAARRAGRFAALARRLISRLSRRARAARHARALAALRRVPLWGDRGSAQLLEIAVACRLRTIFPGDEIVRQGEAGDEFSVIETGTLEVVVDGQHVASLGPGDYFGERALLADAPRAATVRAITQGTLLSLRREDFERLVRDDIQLRTRVTMAIRLRERLERAPLLSELPARELDLLVTRFEERKAEAGAVIVSEGDPGDAFYVLDSGTVTVSRGGTPLSELTAGECFGEIALLTGGPRTATVTACGDVRLLALSAVHFREVLAQYCARSEALEELSRQRLEGHRGMGQTESGR